MIPQRLSRTFAQLGGFDGLLYIVAEGLRRLSRGRVSLIRFYLVAQPIPVVVESSYRPSKRHLVSEVDASDPLVQQFPRPQSVIGKRFRDGNTCLAARAGDRFAGFLWLARGGYDEDVVRCRYQLASPEASAWDYDVYVEPHFRLGRTFVRLWDAANRHLADQGVRWTFSRIACANVDSLRSHAKLGIRKLYSVSFLCLGSWQIMMAGAAPFFHVSLSADSRPTLVITPP